MFSNHPLHCQTKKDRHRNIFICVDTLAAKHICMYISAERKRASDRLQRHIANSKHTETRKVACRVSALIGLAYSPKNMCVSLCFYMHVYVRGCFCMCVCECVLLFSLCIRIIIIRIAAAAASPLPYTHHANAAVSHEYFISLLLLLLLLLLLFFYSLFFLVFFFSSIYLPWWIQCCVVAQWKCEQERGWGTETEKTSLCLYFAFHLPLAILVYQIYLLIRTVIVILYVAEHNKNI